MTDSGTFPSGPLSSEVPPPTAGTRGRRALALLVPVLVLVNSAAIWGQAGWALEHIAPAGWDWTADLALALGFAAAIELIGVFLATAADEAEAAGQPAGGIRLGSYAVGIVSGALNLSHWAGASVAAALAFGFMSAVSPFLWGVWARVRRGRPVAPSRRFWHPRRSVSLIRHMAWYGIVDESDAITDLEFRNLAENAPTSGSGTGMTQTDWALKAIRMKEETGQSWEKIASALGISAGYLYQCRMALKKLQERK
jgi:hypothetical protein